MNPVALTPIGSRCPLHPVPSHFTAADVAKLQQNRARPAKSAPPRPERRPDDTDVAGAAAGAVVTGAAIKSGPLTLTFPGRVVGNNGKGGLLRMHWAAKKKLTTRFIWQVLAQAGGRRFTGPVRLELVRYSIGSPMDYDNLVSTGKLLTDAIVRAGVLPDDTPAVIAEREYRQERAAGKDGQKTVVVLSGINSTIPCLIRL